MSKALRVFLRHRLTSQPEDTPPEFRGCLRIRAMSGMDEPAKRRGARFSCASQVPPLCFRSARLTACQKEQMTDVAHLLQRRFGLEVKGKDLAQEVAEDSSRLRGSPAVCR